MLHHPNYDRLRQLKLDGMADGFEGLESQSSTAALSHQEYLSTLIDHEEVFRKNKRIQNLIRAAKFRILTACPEDINYRARRGLDKGICKSLLTCQWIKNRQNLVMTGPCGIGKTWLACAIGVAACRNGYRTSFKRLPRLYDELERSHGDGSFPQLLRSLVKPQLLILDEWGPDPMNQINRRDLREIIDERDGTGSTIIISQIPLRLWDKVIGDPSYTDSILDRVVSNAHRLELDGDSLRKLLVPQH